MYQMCMYCISLQHALLQKSDYRQDLPLVQETIMQVASAALTCHPPAVIAVTDKHASATHWVTTEISAISTKELVC